MPDLSIKSHSCPIFATHQGILRFAGSALFFLHEGQVLAATADHVVKPYGEASFEMVIEAQAIPVEILKRAPAYDLCLLRPLEEPDGITMRLSTERMVPSNRPLYAMEYSTTIVNEAGQYILNPATRIGNCTRLLQIDDHRAGGADMLELSFPAILGASGAPVIDIRGDQLIARGIMVSNAEYDAVPASILTVLEHDNELIEEHKFFLPQGLAVHSMHLARLATEYLAENVGAAS